MPSPLSFSAPPTLASRLALYTDLVVEPSALGAALSATTEQDNLGALIVRAMRCLERVRRDPGDSRGAISAALEREETP